MVDDIVDDDLNDAFFQRKTPELVVKLNNQTSHRLKMRVRRVDTRTEVQIIVTVVEEST